MTDEFLDSLDASRSILENAIEGILIAEVKTRKIKYVNAAICKMFGFSAEELIGLSVTDIHPSEYLQAVSEKFDNIGHGESLFANGIPCKRKNGTVFIADIAASIMIINGITCNVGFFTDVTKIRQSEEATRKSENQFKSLFMSMSDAFYLSEIIYDDSGNPCDYKYVEVNPQFEHIVGLGRDQIIGRRYKEIVPVDTTKWLEAYCTVARTGKPMSYEFYSEEYQMHFETYSYQPAIGQVCVIVRNVTERKQMEDALRNTQKLESLGVLAGGIAHDFNNLLAGIFGYVDLALSSSDNEQTIRYLKSTILSMHRARALTLQLLTFAKGGAPVQKLTPLFPFIQEAAQFALSGSNVSCRFIVNENLMSCNIDKNQISQVIDNIVINAKQAMPLGGNIEISAENISFGENEHSWLSKGDYVKVSIRDCGTGISREVMPHIFDPFYTTKTTGHGLGLATCYSIIKRHGGCIDVDSEPGHGSTFHIFLPASSETVVNETVAEVKHKGSGVIIVVDDDELLRELFQDMLESMGYSVVCKSDGRDAIDFFVNETNAGRTCTAMIFDLTIPGGIGGQEAAGEIRKIDKEIPIFVASGYSDNAVMENPVKHGFTASISKPFTMTEVSEMFEKYLNVKKVK